METTFDLDGTTYTYTHMTTRTSLHLQLRLGKVIGPALKAFFSGGPGDISVQALGATAVSELLQNLDEGTLDATILAFGKQCSYTDGTGTYRLDLAWEKHFAGRHLTLFSWLGKCAEAEWASFFTGLTRLLGASPSPDKSA